ncbi:MAG: ABC transporter permease [Lachnospiraceae bacterium]|nr:ABC transporter permease [Lachnospiraceae bacterium]
MAENIRLSFQSIWAHKMRSFLTMLGIIIGIAAIIAIVSTINGTNEEIKNQLIGSGSNKVSITLKKNGYGLSISGQSSIPSGVPVLDDETREEILALDSVENVTSYTERTELYECVYYQGEALSSPSIRGIDLNYFDTDGYRIRSGRGFVESDYTNFRNVVIIDDTIADNYFQNEAPVGQTLIINGVSFTIIGVAVGSDSYTEGITSASSYYLYMEESYGYLFIPNACWPLLFCFDEPGNVIVKAVSTDDMEKAGSETEKILNNTISSYQTKVEYVAENLVEQAKQIDLLSDATSSQLIWIASISLLVGGIGVMNVMMMTVTERTAEIGLKKAIGARKRAILGQFLTESVVLTSIGGLLGVGAGIGMAYAINKISGVAVAISVPASALAVTFSMAIGIIFGLVPSMKAANLDPIEALRRE